MCLCIYNGVEIYKDNLAFPYFSICLSGQATQRTNEKYGKRAGKTSELVFTSYQVVSYEKFKNQCIWPMSDKKIRTTAEGGVLELIFIS